MVSHLPLLRKAHVEASRLIVPPRQLHRHKTFAVTDDVFDAEPIAGLSLTSTPASYEPASPEMHSTSSTTATSTAAASQNDRIYRISAARMPQHASDPSTTQDSIKPYPTPLEQANVTSTATYIGFHCIYAQHSWSGPHPRTPRPLDKKTVGVILDLLGIILLTFGPP